MFDNPLAPEPDVAPRVETEVLSGEVAAPPDVESIGGETEAHFDLIVRHPSHQIRGRIPIVCRGESLARARELTAGTAVTVAGIRAFDDDRKPSEFVLCKYLQVISGGGDLDSEN